MQKILLTTRGAFVRVGVWSALAGCIVGSTSMHYFYDRTHVPLEALRQARGFVDAEMQAACSNWFTDKRAKDLPAGRVVVCKAPSFLSNTQEK